MPKQPHHNVNYVERHDADKCEFCRIARYTPVKRVGLPSYKKAPEFLWATLHALAQRFAR